MWNLIHNWRELRRRGVLGINRRNAEFLLPCNHRKFYPLVDNKLKTKQLASAAGVAVPHLLGVVQVQQQVTRGPSPQPRERRGGRARAAPVARQFARRWCYRSRRPSRSY